MPLDSIEAAREWRLNNQPEGVGHRGKNSTPKRFQSNVPESPASPPSVPLPESPKPPAQLADESDADYLARVCSTEHDIYNSLRRALVNEPGAVVRLQQWHVNACKARNEVEAALIAKGKESGKLLDKEMSISVMTEVIGAVLLHLESLPKQLSSKFPGVEPVEAEAIIQDAVNELRRKAEAQLRQNKLNQ
jgi:hypothetical protein